MKLTNWLAKVPMRAGKLRSVLVWLVHRMWGFMPRWARCWAFLNDC